MDTPMPTWHRRRLFLPYSRCFFLLSVPTSSSLITARSSTSLSCAASRRDRAAWTRSCSTTRCRWCARSRRTRGNSKTSRGAAGSTAAERYASAVARLRALTEEADGTLNGSIDRLLERVTLSTSEGVDLAPDRINLLTLHSTKGLEFSRVYIVGVEDYEIPGFQAATNNIKDEIEEARRLLYVGMTRARELLVLTWFERRFGRVAWGC